MKRVSAIIVALIVLAVAAYGFYPVRIYKERVGNWKLLSRVDADELWISVGVYGWEGPRWRAPGSPFFSRFRRITHVTWRVARYGDAVRLFRYETSNDIAGLVAPIGDSIYVISSMQDRWEPRFFRVVEQELAPLAEEESERIRQSFRYLTDLYERRMGLPRSTVA